MYLFSTSFVKRNKMHIFQLIAGYYLIFSTRQYAQSVMLLPVLPSHEMPEIYFKEFTILPIIHFFINVSKCCGPESLDKLHHTTVI